MQPCSQPWYGLIDWLNGMSGDALCAMMVRAGWIVTVVLSGELSGGAAPSSPGSGGSDPPAVVVGFAAFAAKAIERIERGAAAAFGRLARRAPQRIGCGGQLIVGSGHSAFHEDHFTRIGAWRLARHYA